MLWDPGDWAKGGWRTVGDSGPIPNWSLSLYTFAALVSCLLFPLRCSVALKLISILLKGHFTQINEKLLTQLERSLAVQIFLEQSEQSDQSLQTPHSIVWLSGFCQVKLFPQGTKWNIFCDYCEFKNQEQQQLLYSISLYKDFQNKRHLVMILVKFPPAFENQLCRFLSSMLHVDYPE